MRSAVPSIATVEGIILCRKVRSIISHVHGGRELFFFLIIAGLQPPITVPSLIRGILPCRLLGQLQKVSDGREASPRRVARLNGNLGCGEPLRRRKTTPRYSAAASTPQQGKCQGRRQRKQVWTCY